MKKLFAVFVIVLAVFVIAGCTASPNGVTPVSEGDEPVAGFWQGLWHGIIAPFAFLISLFSDSVGVYEVVNNGGWYNFGFLLGVSIIFGGGGGGAASRRKRKYD